MLFCRLTILHKRFDTGINKASIPTKALIPSLVFLFAKDLFIKFMKVIMEIMQAQTQTELQKRPLKARNSKTY